MRMVTQNIEVCKKKKKNNVQSWRKKVIFLEKNLKEYSV